MTGSGGDAALIEVALDAARVVDDFVRGVVAAAGGEIGGGRDVASSRTRRVLGNWIYSERHVVQGMGRRYGAEQLRKAADAADELVVAIGRLGRAEGEPGREASAALAALGVAELPATLRRPELASNVGRLGTLAHEVGRVIGVLNEARTRQVLAEMRGRTGDTGP